VTYTNRTPGTAPSQLLGFLQANAARFGIDSSRIGLWSCSGNVPNALELLIDRQPAAACAVFAYGYMLDGPGSAVVADAARRFGFVNPVAGRSVADVPGGVPLLVVRAGLDEMPGLNETIDRFVGQATARNLPVSLINHARGAHAFDINEPTEGTGRVVRQILAFLRLHLNG
jgi:hypothetical protein